MLSKMTCGYEAFSQRPGCDPNVPVHHRSIIISSIRPLSPSAPLRRPTLFKKTYLRRSAPLFNPLTQTHKTCVSAPRPSPTHLALAHKPPSRIPRLTLFKETCLPRSAPFHSPLTHLRIRPTALSDTSSPKHTSLHHPSLTPRSTKRHTAGALPLPTARSPIHRI